MTSKTKRSEPLTYREMLERAGEHYPTFCPECGSDGDLLPTFDGELWDCGACGSVWEVKS